MSDTSDSENSKLLEFTRMFWNSFCTNDFPSVAALLAPDCCIRTNFADADPGICGIAACLNHLKDIYAKMKLPGSRMDMTQIQHLRLMPISKQTRFMISGKPGYISSNMGFAIEWQLEMIVDFVIVRNTSASMFFSASSVSTVQQDEDASWGLNIFSKTSTDTPGTASIEASASASTIMDRRLSSGRSACRLEDTLSPPFLHPKPPPVPPTVTVTILECTNLKSRLVRIISRPVSAFVTVSLGGITRRTETVKYNNYPCFDSTNAFTFEISDHDRDDGILHFIVSDEHVVNDDILSETDVPLASLRAAVDNTSPYEIKLPLVLGETHFGLALTSNNAIDDEPPMLRVRINKVDAMEWWAKREVALREQVQEERDVQRLTSHGLSDSHQLPLSHDSASAGSKPRRSSFGPLVGLLGDINHGSEHGIGDKVPKSEWVDEKHVVICMHCLKSFSLTRRKHHCRSCGEVFCDRCCHQRVRLLSQSGSVKKHRVCSRCMTSKYCNRDSIVEGRDSGTLEDDSDSDDDMA